MPSRKIHKVLVAARGEIAVRVIRTLKKLSISSVAIYADNDSDALFCRMADEARPLGGGTIRDTYLNIQKIIDAALDTGADAVHPGYGFLSESPEFAEACAENNIIFIGPDADAMRLMGNKVAARRFAIEHHIPVTFGMTGTIDEIVSRAGSLPYPVLIKAAAGGGGKGMHIVKDTAALRPALETASSQALQFFGNGEVFVEQYIENPRHIEVQVLADHFGNVVHLFERECSVQRRYQKIIEESPSPTLTPEKRKEICDTAVSLCRQVGYKNAGTVEFLVDKDLNFYFLEMNTRIQVEHPVTEQRTGIDIVEEQIRIARGKEMGWTQDVIQDNGHAIECRVYAEDPENNFAPAPDEVTLYHEPQMRGLRIDSSIDNACTISPNYDPMIAKVICFGKRRSDAMEIMRKALREYIVQTEKNNIPYLQSIIENQDFIDNKIDTSYCEKHQDELIETTRRTRENIKKEDVAAMFLFYDFNKNYLENRNIDNVWNAIGYWRFQMSLNVFVENVKCHVSIKSLTHKALHCTINGIEYSVMLTQNDSGIRKVIINGRTEAIFVSQTPGHESCVHFRGLDFICHRGDQLNDMREFSQEEFGDEDLKYYAPMPCNIEKICVSEGDTVRRGDVLCVTVAMKMFSDIVAKCDGKVAKVNVKVGDKVDKKKVLIELSI
ncbi:MAG: ATP-grasp domain-containing protein [Bacteroidales bacterium]|nr:ATP-grasp domain-containing protein [Bacteroidales bacterium]